MPSLTHRDFEALLSAYLDGELSGDRLMEFESYLAQHGEAERELQAYRRMQGVLAAQGKLPPDPAFYSKLTRRLEDRRAEKENLLPFPRKYLPVAVGLTSVALVAVGIVMYTERGSIFNFLDQTSQEVQTAFEQNLLKGTIVPLFAGLDRDHVLRYALFGTLPLDEDSDRALRVDETSEQGYRIEMGSTVKESTPRVTVEDFLAEVEPTPSQSIAIDSVLDDVRKQIETSAFYAENSAIAIDPELTKLNRATLVSLASVLQGDQRKRFDTFLKRHGSTYVVAEPDEHGTWQARSVARRPVKHPRPEAGVRSYFVMSPDTFVFTQLEMNLREIEEKHQQLIGVRQKREADIDRLVDHLQQLEAARHREISPGEAPIVVRGRTGYVSIRINGALVEGPEDSALQVVMRRPDQPKIFLHEFEAGEGTMVFEYNMQISGGLDSLAVREMARARELQDHLRQQDSILRIQRRSPTGVVAPVDTVRGKRRY